ncbi:hypothetical protein Ga0466249_005158 [Sporomusaceae bacterium BoRhaA]|uniref:hypothetical protein n=1 Tax=Pelorhabdus rhamnosifermentans TaxID=2772457 RepID=UPI001FE832BB|nr:hypothetical protein [Pelorhabdus rhamnosifermentans]MBU2704006.1 hypothetical protein [Pelorhabdus rhamnosifermentans]
MCKNLQELTIKGIPIRADPSLSPKEIHQIVCEIVQEWTWEGRKLGKIELICAGGWVHICSYEKPIIQLIPAKYVKE